MRSNASQLLRRAPVPPYTTRSSGRSATSGSRLFISIRSAASWIQPATREARCRAGRARCGRLTGLMSSMHLFRQLERRRRQHPVRQRLGRLPRWGGLPRGRHQPPHRAVEPLAAESGAERAAGTRAHGTRTAARAPARGRCCPPPGAGGAPAIGAMLTWSSMPAPVGNRVDAGRVAQRLVLGHQRRGGVLGEHVARLEARARRPAPAAAPTRGRRTSRSMRRSESEAHLGHRDLEVVARPAPPAGRGTARPRSPRPIGGEHQRVVVDAVHLDRAAGPRRGRARRTTRPSPAARSA